MNYTQGPWKFKDLGNLRILAPDGRCVASILSTVKKPFDEKIANAHLIAAAPELHEACKLALEVMVKFDTEKKVISGLSLKLKAALAKAEGEK